MLCRYLLKTLLIILQILIVPMGRASYMFEVGTFSGVDTLSLIFVGSSLCCKTLNR